MTKRNQKFQRGMRLIAKRATGKNGGRLEHRYMTFVSYVATFPDGRREEDNVILPLLKPISEPVHIPAIQAHVAEKYEARDDQTGVVMVGRSEVRIRVTWWKQLGVKLVEMEPEAPPAPPPAEEEQPEIHDEGPGPDPEDEAREHEMALAAAADEGMDHSGPDEGAA